MQRPVTARLGGAVQSGVSAAPMVVVTCALALAVGIIHLALTVEYLGEELLLGLGFLVGGIGLVAGATVVPTRVVGAMTRPVMDLLALTLAGMFVGGILSRTVGLFGFLEKGNWEPLLVISLTLEAVALACWPFARRLVAPTPGLA
ncbi:hypothetical protein ACWF0M_13440 [Kribbella sp. NPDC055110]